MPNDGGPISPDLGPVLATFFDASHRIEPDRLVELVAVAGASLGATALRLWLADHEQRQLMHLPVANHAPLAPLAIEGTSAGRCFVSSDAVERSEPAGSDHVWLPLVNGVDRIGVMEIEAPVLDPEHLESFRHLSSAATAEIVTRGQYTDHFLEVRRRRRMTLAAELQWQALPPASFTSTDVAVAGILEPAYDVGGDTFDYAHSRDRLDVAILDAVGHDLASTLICTLALGAYRNSRREGGDLRDHAARMDRTMHEQLARGSFATGQIGTLDTSTGMFRWLNAGHPPPLLVRDGHVRPLACRPRLPFGIGHMEPDRIAEIAEDQLQPGDGILLYTDGVVEARTPGGEDFGMDRLMELLHTAFAAGLAPHETLRRLSHAVVDFQGGPLRDDATNLLIVWQQDHH